MSEPASENSGTREYILIAEDSPPNRKILAHLLKKLDYEVIECVDGQEAWDKHLKESKINLVAILSDIMMPNLDGIGLLKCVREQSSYKDIPFILITAVSDKDYIVQAKNLSVNGYILKPVTFQRVTSKLKELFPKKKFPQIAS
ncbi:MAG: response regulator [Bdellovibrionales bacterium]|nr:response regulator [Bdellovibrionales bacterium]